jgi:hypothetical protein
MQMRSSVSRKPRWPVFFYAGVPVVITGALWATSAYQLSLPQLGAALILCWIPWAAYQQWHRGSRQGLPLFAMIAAMHWLGYAVPLFWGSHGIGLATGFHRLSEAALTKSMYLAITGMVTLWVGMKLATNWHWAPSIPLDVPQSPGRWHYLRILLVAGTLMKVLVGVPDLTDSVRQILILIENIVPSVTFAILLRSHLRGRAGDFDKVLLIGYVLVALALGLSSGWMGTVVGFGVICIATYVLERRRFPVLAIALILPIVLFLQPGKEKFRLRYWERGPASIYSDYGERIGYWLNASAQQWANAITDPSGNGVRELASSTLYRVSLLEQTGNVVEMTPQQVPYQYGRLYRYLLITWIPRVLWPEKHGFNDANRWYQVAYHLNSPAQLQTVSIAVGVLTESYISFGWAGPVFVMFCLGFFLGVVQKIFFRPESGLLLNSIGIALLPGLLVLESQMAEYVSGLAQQVLIALVFLALILRLTPTGERAQRVSPSVVAMRN